LNVIAPYLPGQMSFLRVIPDAWRVPFTFPAQRNRLPLLNRHMNYRGVSHKIINFKLIKF